jgi:2-oxo-4-hydroxy-4-carboxy-5-ureidoimidazoline decarboxylase
MEPWRRLDLAAPDEARALLRTCCGASRWVARMLDRRPFGNRHSLLNAAREEWFSLSPTDWREAFTHHPKIGDREALRRRFAMTRHLSEQEQAGMSSASEALLAEIVEGNRIYEEKFGYIFIVCATGRTAAEMLALLQSRLRNDPATEVGIAADEQAKITEIRLLGLT